MKSFPRVSPYHVFTWNSRRCPEFCGVETVEHLGENSTQEDLCRYWSAFETIISNQWLLAELGINLEDSECIDEWLWNNGSWGEPVDFILDGPGAR